MLQKITLFTALLLGSTTFAQTSVISTKSHNATLKDLTNAEDNFGEREMNYPPVQLQQTSPPNFTTAVQFEVLTKIDEHCVIRKGKAADGQTYVDTICNFWYYEEHNYNKQSMRDYHGENVQLIGFPENSSSLNGNDAPFSGRTSRFGASWAYFLLVLGALGGFVFFPKSKA